MSDYTDMMIDGDMSDDGEYIGELPEENKMELTKNESGQVTLVINAAESKLLEAIADFHVSYTEPDQEFESDKFATKLRDELRVLNK